MAEQNNTATGDEKPKTTRKTAVEKLTKLQRVIFDAEFPTGKQILQHQRRGNIFITRRTEVANGSISYLCFNYGRKVSVKKGRQTVEQWSNEPNSSRYTFELVKDIEKEKQVFARHIAAKYGSKTPNS